ncbi:MAG: glycosyltransferase, partial [Candidatus Latescibacteria bacterium]|nr:glycosyltransferase [Candidatus Latescibacterota bacterium]
MLALEGLGAYLDVGLVILVLLYFLGACWFVLGTRRKNVTTDRVPMVSVVVAARNEAERIAGCLSVLLVQDYPHKQYEVIVVDDGSTDDTAGIIGEHLDSPVSVRLLQTEGLGSKKAALSLGIAEAKGDVILSTDADCLV